MAIKLLLLKSGEDMIADVKEMAFGEEDQRRVVGYYLNKPCVIKMRDPNLLNDESEGRGRKAGYEVSLFPWIPLSAEETIPVPSDWASSTTNAAVRDNAIDGSIKTVIVTGRGVSLGTANAVYTNVPIKGNGTGAECTITMNADSQVESVTVSSQGSGYTYGNVDLVYVRIINYQYAHNSN